MSETEIGAEGAGAEPRLTVALGGYEGPLDLLLTLARDRRIDLATVSIVALVDQYLAFVATARRLRLELAADWLVMAAWLAYLKSALLLPADATVESDPHQLAARLAHRLRRLEAMRDAGAALQRRDQIGREVATRGMPEGLRVIAHGDYDVDLYALLRAYAAIEARRDTAAWTPPARAPVVTLEQALARLLAALGGTADWIDLRALLPADNPAIARSANASALIAALELARRGKARLRQDGPFTPLLVRAGGG